jgi:hypothetical protein
VLLGIMLDRITRAAAGDRPTVSTDKRQWWRPAAN